MRRRFFVSAVLIAASAALWTVPTESVGRPGITPVACPQQTWQPTDPAFDALPGAKAYFGRVPTAGFIASRFPTAGTVS